MCQYRNAACLVNEFDGVGHRSPRSGHIRELSFAEVFVEGFLLILDDAALHERLGKVQTREIAFAS